MATERPNSEGETKPERVFDHIFSNFNQETMNEASTLSEELAKLLQEGDRSTAQLVHSQISQRIQKTHKVDQILQQTLSQLKDLGIEQPSLEDFLATLRQEQLAEKPPITGHETSLPQDSGVAGQPIHEDSTKPIELPKPKVSLIPEESAISVDGSKIEVGVKEYELFEYMLGRGQCSTLELAMKMYGGTLPSDRNNIRAMILRLRKRFVDTGKDPNIIRSQQRGPASRYWLDVEGVDHEQHVPELKAKTPEAQELRENQIRQEIESGLTTSEIPAIGQEITGSEVLESQGYFQVQAEERTVTTGGKTVILTPREFELFSYLSGKMGEKSETRELAEHVYKVDQVSQSDLRNVLVLVNSLRKKFGETGQNAKIIRSGGRGGAFKGLYWLGTPENATAQNEQFPPENAPIVNTGIIIQDAERNLEEPAPEEQKGFTHEELLLLARALDKQADGKLPNLGINLQLVDRLELSKIWSRLEAELDSIPTKRIAKARPGLTKKLSDFVENPEKLLGEVVDDNAQFLLSIVSQIDTKEKIQELLGNSEKIESHEPSNFSPQDLTVPNGTRREKRQWLDSIIERQRKNAEKGIRPQPLKGRVTQEINNRWTREVWKPYLRTLPRTEREALRAHGQGRTKNTRAQGPVSLRAN